jgi:hypothetical protein
MLSFAQLSEKATKVKINPKVDDIKEEDGVKKGNHGEDCDCMKCEKKRRKGDSDTEVTTESAVPGKPAEKVGALTNIDIPQSERDAAKARLLAKAKAKREKMKESYYDPMEDDDFDHDEAERTRGQSGKNKSITIKKKTKKTTKEETAYVSQEEVSEESNQSFGEEETLLTFGQFSEGMSMKDFKANRTKLKRRESSADAEKRGHVGKEWYNSGRKYSPDEAKRSRANMDDEERRTRHRSAVDPDNEDDNNYSADKTKNPKKQRKQAAMGEEVGLDERTRYAKETGKDFQTGKPSEKGGTLGGDDRHSKVMRHMQKDLRKSGGLMSSRGKPIKPQGKKKDKGAKPSFKMEPTSVDKIKAKLAQKRKPKPDISSRFD